MAVTKKTGKKTTKKATKAKGKRDHHKNELGRNKKAVKQSDVELTDPTKEGLSPKEEAFCQWYVSPTEFYGNGTQSYIEAYDVQIVNSTQQKYDVNGEKLDKKKKKMTIGSVRDAAYKLLMRTDILGRINEILEDSGLNDAFVDKQLKHLITQSADPRVKISAIAEYNKLMSRIVSRESHIHAFANEDMSDEELMQRIEKNKAFFSKK